MITSVGTGKHLQNRLRGFKKKRSVQSTGWRKRKRERGGSGKDRRRGQRKRKEGGEKGRKFFLFCNRSGTTYRTGKHLQTTHLIKVIYSEFRLVFHFGFQS